MNWREIDRLRKDPVGFRTLAKALLAYEDHDAWKTAFLESIVRLTGVEEFTTRQSEKLLEIRDGTVAIKTFDGFSVATLIRGCHDARLDLSEDDEQWIAAVYVRDATSIKRRHIGRLMGIARQVGLIEREPA